MSQANQTNQNFQLANKLEVPLGVVDFSDLKQMLFKSFIELKSMYKDFIPISFKSLNDNEIHRIRTLAGDKDAPDFLTRQNIYYLLFSIYQIDGVNILSDRDLFLNNLYTLVETLHPKLFVAISKQLYGVHERVSKAIRLVERYTIEPDSKWLWYALRDKSLVSEEVTGIKGTSSLGYNICHLLWIYYNRKEDEKNQFKQMWQCAKLVASVLNPKAVQKLNQQEELKEKEEQKRKEALVYGDDFSPKFKVESAEELIQQLEKDISGEKDIHDEIIERNLKYNKFKQKEQEAQFKKALPKRPKNYNPLLDYDPEEVSRKVDQFTQFQEALVNQYKNQKALDREHSSKSHKYYENQDLSEEDIKYFKELEKKVSKKAPEKSDQLMKKMMPGEAYEKLYDPEAYLEKVREKVDNPEIYTRYRTRKKDS